MQKAFYSYTDPNDPYKKYNLKNDNKFTSILNDHPNGYVLGEIATYDKIIAEAKLMGYDFIELAQKRRHLNMPDYPDADKVYHTFFYVNGDNIALWRHMHKTAADFLEYAAGVLVRKYTEYAEATRFVLTNNIIFPHNMFAMSLDKFERYNAWLQSILSNLEFPSDPPKIASLLAERLFTIYVFHNFGIKDTVWVTANAYNKYTGEKLQCVNGVAD